MEFRLEVVVGHRMRQAADGMRDAFFQSTPIVQNDRDYGTIFRHGGIDRCTDMVAQGDDLRVADSRIGELQLACLSVDGRHGGTVINAELALEPELRSTFSRELEHERMHAELDGGDLIGRKVMFLAKLNAAVD